MKNWLLIFDQQEWDEFLAGRPRPGSPLGPNNSLEIGFKPDQRRLDQISVGDRMVCYIKGGWGFVGVLSVEGQMFESQRRIWESFLKPKRFCVDVLVKVIIANCVAPPELKLDMVTNPDRWGSSFVSNLREIDDWDTGKILNALRLRRSHQDKGYQEVCDMLQEAHDYLSPWEDYRIKSQILQAKRLTEQKIHEP